jgi:hypothetical protein
MPGIPWATFLVYGLLYQRLAGKSALFFESGNNWHISCKHFLIRDISGFQPLFIAIFWNNPGDYQ